MPGSTELKCSIAEYYFLLFRRAKASLFDAEDNADDVTSVDRNLQGLYLPTGAMEPNDNTGTEDVVEEDPALDLYVRLCCFRYLSLHESSL